MTAIAFLRPGLGLGGAERLALDAATQLQRRGCRVRFYVPDGPPVPEFPEVSERTVSVERVHTWLPADIGGRLRAPMAIARTAAAGRAIARSAQTPDLIFCDLVPHVVPLVKRLTRRPVLFFCHYPDLLLTPDASRASPAYRFYRRRLDRQEAEGLRAADRVIVNSAFTAATVSEVFAGLGRTPVVVHPGVPMDAALHATPIPDEGEIVLLSVSRFDPRKGLQLAIEAVAELRPLVPPAVFSRVRLVMAGRFNEALPERARLLEERDRLLTRCRAVVYTPSAEPFGYVPLEAMAAGRPVVAVNHGGPTETVIHGRTGFLCEPDSKAFAGALSTLVTRVDFAQEMGRAGRDHVQRRFSVDAFGERLWDVVRPLLAEAPAAGVS